MRSRTHDLLSLLAAIGLCTGTTVASVLHVDDDAPPGGDGQSWATAYRFLQDGLAAAVAGDEIRVAQGLYLPDRDEANPGGTSNQLATFQLVDGVLLAGGYAGLGSGDPDARDVSIYVTTLSGDLAGDDDPDPVGSGFLGYDENSRHVVTGSGNDDTALIDGVTVTAGNASVSGDNSGGGMIAIDGSPTVQNCRFECNYANGAGGIEIVRGNPAINGSTFLENVAQSGGAIRCIDVTSVTISNCSFIANRAESSMYGGGGVVVQTSRMGTVNHADITGCLFLANYAEYEGGATVTTLGGRMTMSNSTVVENSAGISGGGVCTGTDGITVVVNSIIYSNTAGESDPQIFNLEKYGPAMTRVSSSNTEGGLGGVGIYDDGGNIDAAPLFFDPDGPDNDPMTFDDNDYHLVAGSPSINTGYLESVPEGVLVDRDGNPRLIDCQVDMGAYENQDSLYAPGDTDCNGLVGFVDLVDLLGDWGMCGLCPADTDHDGEVNFIDLTTLLSNWI